MVKRLCLLTAVMLFAIMSRSLNNNGELNTMTKHTKTDPKSVKTTTKSNINWHKLIRKFIAKPLAYVTVFILASYGMRQALHTLDDNAAMVITVLAVAGLCFIMFDSE